MRPRSKAVSSACLLIAGLSVLAPVRILAQSQFDELSNPLNSVLSQGFFPAGVFSLSSIESVNPTNGVLSLNIPLAHLPPGPGGFSAGVNLVYNSSIFDLSYGPLVNPNGSVVSHAASATLQVSKHGGGWNYGYKFTLWTQPRFPSSTQGIPLNCSPYTKAELTDWYKTYLRTPDGVNHLLRLSRCS